MCSEAKIGKGRSKYLITLRNNKILHRYKYLSKKGRTHLDILSQLSLEEFFISEQRIERILITFNPNTDDKNKKNKT